MVNKYTWDSMESYNFNKNWISRLIESDFPIKIENPLLSSIIKFGLVSDILVVLLYTLRGHLISEMSFIGLILAVIWINIGPYLIWYYDEHLLPSSFRKISELVYEPDKMKKLSRKYDNLFTKRYWIPTLIWVAMLVFGFFYSSNLFVKLGFFEMGGVFFWVLLAGVIWAGLLHGAGFTGVLTTLISLREISEMRIEIDPFHPDHLGGLSPIGFYSIRTTLLFSSGSLFLPLGFEIVAESPSPNLMHFLIGIYILFIALTFLYPVLKIHGEAEESQARKMKELRDEYEEIKTKLSSHTEESFKPDIERLVLELEMENKREEYREHKKTSLYPMEIETVAQLLGSILLPLLFLFLEIYLDEIVTFLF